MPWYMCILLYVKLFGVVVFHRCYGQLTGGDPLPSVYVHSAIC